MYTWPKKKHSQTLISSILLIILGSREHGETQVMRPFFATIGDFVSQPATSVLDFPWPPSSPRAVDLDPLEGNDRKGNLWWSAISGGAQKQGPNHSDSTCSVLLMDQIRRENQLGHGIVYPISYRVLCTSGSCWGLLLSAVCLEVFGLLYIMHW